MFIQLRRGRKAGFEVVRRGGKGVGFLGKWGEGEGL